jgi:putative spermidine/putrescine transport system ATP-binding protein
MTDGATRLELSAVAKFYGPSLGVGPLDLDVQPGEFVSLVGPSGCGKTTTLRLIAGLEQPSAGLLKMNGTIVNDLPTHRRNIGLVFQNYALFPHLNIADNIAFGLRYRNIRGTEAADRVASVLKLVRLEGLDKRMPRQLSGGQQQRVALARAIVINPSLLLFDEPLSNLDMTLRQRMQEEIKRVQQEVGITTVYVTHDQSEAMVMSDRIAILFRGHLHQYAPPHDIYEHPATPDVADFIGEINYLEGTLQHMDGAPQFVTSRGTILHVASHGTADGPNRLAIRPHRVRILTEDNAGGGINRFETIVEQTMFAGDVIRATLRLPTGDVIQVNAHNLQELQSQLARKTLTVELRPEDLQIFPTGG